MTARRVSVTTPKASKGTVAQLGTAHWKGMTTDERIKAIKAGIARGLTSTAIAVELGAPTRDVVIGVAWRNGVRWRAVGAAPAPPAPPAPPAKPRLTRPSHAARDPATQRSDGTGIVARGKLRNVHDGKLATGLSGPLSGSHPVPFTATVANHCRWPVAGVGMAMFCCGLPVDLNGMRPYCEQHSRLAYVAAPLKSIARGPRL